METPDPKDARIIELEGKLEQRDRYIIELESAKAELSDRLANSVTAHNEIFDALRECEEKRNAQSLRLGTAIRAAESSGEQLLAALNSLRVMTRERNEFQDRLGTLESALRKIVDGRFLGYAEAKEIAQSAIAVESPAERSIIADGFGGQWARCEREHQCGLQVVRPGKAACCLDPDECPRGGSLVQIVGAVETHGRNCAVQGCRKAATHGRWCEFHATQTLESPVRE